MTTHICSWAGTAKRDMTPSTVRLRCDMETPRGQCSKWADGGAIYPWGAMAYCQKHLDEECEPEKESEGA